MLKRTEPDDSKKKNPNKINDFDLPTIDKNFASCIVVFL